MINRAFALSYFSHEDDSYSPRPELRGLALGLEYAWAPRIVGVRLHGAFVRNLTEAGYWDDIEEPESYEDGRWIDPSGFNLLAVGVDLIVQAPLAGGDDGVALEFVASGGLFGAFGLGEIAVWESGTTAANGCEETAAAYDRYQSCAADGTLEVPMLRLLPKINLDVGLRLWLPGHRFFARVDGGLHPGPFVGGALGVGL